eukprot:6988756-Prymnesium_polylepis.1
MRSRGGGRGAGPHGAARVHPAASLAARLPTRACVHCEYVYNMAVGRSRWHGQRQVRSQVTYTTTSAVCACGHAPPRTTHRHRTSSLICRHGTRPHCAHSVSHAPHSPAHTAHRAHRSPRFSHCTTQPISPISTHNAPCSTTPHSHLTMHHPWSTTQPQPTPPHTTTRTEERSSSVH